MLVFSLLAASMGCQKKVDDVSPDAVRGVPEDSQPKAQPKAKPASKPKPKPRTVERDEPKPQQGDAPADDPGVYRLELKDGTVQLVRRRDGKWNVLNEFGSRTGTVDVRSKGLLYLNMEKEGVATVALKEYGCKASDKSGPIMRIWRKESVYEIYDIDGKALGSIETDALTLGKTVVSVTQRAGRIFLTQGGQEVGRIMPARYPQAALFLGVSEWPVELRTALFLYWIIHELP